MSREEEDRTFERYIRLHFPTALPSEAPSGPSQTIRGPRVMDGLSNGLETGSGRSVDLHPGARITVDHDESDALIDAYVNAHFPTPSD